MGNASSSATTSVAAKAPAGADEAKKACPVDHGAAGASSAAGGDCPVDHGQAAKYKNPKVYNVYSQEINPDNMMPNKAAQAKSPGQTKELSTKRVQSTIPKAGTEGTWLYPSPQMFFNALTRKRKRDTNLDEDDMDTVVAVHNNMNERAWMDLRKWEECHRGECDDPRLLRFKGRPFDLSPKARMKTWLGYPPPFDRHDWIVDRCGKEVRYIIDYYYNETVSDRDEKPELNSTDKIKSIDMDVRPALDSFEAFVDRLKFFPERAMAAWNRPKPVDSEPLNHTPPPEVSMALRGSAPSSPPAPVTELTPEQKMSEQLMSSCGKYIHDVDTATTEETRQSATMALMLCMGKHLCSRETASFRSVLSRDDPSDELMQERYETVVQCLGTHRDKFAALRGEE